MPQSPLGDDRIHLCGCAGGGSGSFGAFAHPGKTGARFVVFGLLVAIRPIVGHWSRRRIGVGQPDPVGRGRGAAHRHQMNQMRVD